MDNTIEHFFEYIDYTSLEKKNISFDKPMKNNRGIFVAKLNRPMKFYLPRSEIFDMYQDPFSNNIVNYLINSDLHPEMINFLENLDSMCISIAADYSKEWFNKDLEVETLVKYYNTLYDMSEDESSIYLPIELENTDDIQSISEYNSNSSYILSIKIIGIEFYKQTFKWKLEFNKITHSDVVTRYDTSSDNESSEEEIDFNNIIIKETGIKTTTVNDLPHTTLSSKPTQKKEDIIEETTSEIKKLVDRKIESVPNCVEEEIVNESMINELAEPAINKDLSCIEKETDSVTPEKDYVENNDLSNNCEQNKSEHGTEKIDQIDVNEKSMVTNDATIHEIQRIIQNKRMEARKYSLNASRALRASDTLSLKAEDINKEIALYEDKLKAHVSI